MPASIAALCLGRSFDNATEKLCYGPDRAPHAWKFFQQQETQDLIKDIAIESGHTNCVILPANAAAGVIIHQAIEERARRAFMPALA